MRRLYFMKSFVYNVISDEYFVVDEGMKSLTVKMSLNLREAGLNGVCLWVVRDVEDGHYV